MSNGKLHIEFIEDELTERPYKMPKWSKSSTARTPHLTVPDLRKRARTQYSGTDALKWVMAATAKQDARAQLTAPFYNPKKRETVACDSFRLHIHKGKVSSLPKPPKDARPYPDYTRIDPGEQENATHATANTLDLIDALNAVRVFAQSEFGAATMKLGQGEITITATSAELGDASATLDARVDTPITVGVKVSQMLDALMGMPDTVNIQVTGAQNPIRIDGAENRAIIMPMLIKP